MSNTAVALIQREEVLAWRGLEDRAGQLLLAVQGRSLEETGQLLIDCLGFLQNALCCQYALRVMEELSLEEETT